MQDCEKPTFRSVAAAIVEPPEKRPAVKPA
jgi:hypothetical protein